MRDKRFGLLQIIAIVFVVLAIGVVVCGEKAYSEKIKASCDSTIAEEVTTEEPKEMESNDTKTIVEEVIKEEPIEIKPVVKEVITKVVKPKKRKTVVEDVYNKK